MALRNSRKMLIYFSSRHFCLSFFVLLPLQCYKIPNVGLAKSLTFVNILFRPVGRRDHGSTLSRVSRYAVEQWLFSVL